MSTSRVRVPVVPARTWIAGAIIGVPNSGTRAVSGASAPAVASSTRLAQRHGLDGDLVERVRLGRRDQIVLDRPHLPLGFGRCDDEPLRQRGEYTDHGPVDQQGNDRRDDERTPSSRPRQPDRGEADCAHAQRGDEQAGPGDVALGVAGSVERPNPVRRDRRQCDVHVVQRLERAGEGEERGEVTDRETRRSSLGAILMAVASWPAQRTRCDVTQRRDDQREDRQLAQEGTRRGEEREPEQVEADVRDRRRVPPARGRRRCGTAARAAICRSRPRRCGS